MLSGFLRLHVIPFLGAALLVLAGGYVLVKFDVLDKVHGTERVISIGQNINSQRGRFPNLQNNDSLEAVLYSSLACQNQISIFGSSELTGTQFAPYHFLPDNVGIPCLAIGHAHHQSFSILAELLANQEVLKNSKICILLSLTWFETKGTNAEAFVEFVKPNMMNRILHNSKIQSKYLKHISNTISYLEDDLSGENAQMRAFKQQNLSSNDRVNAYLSLISREINVPLTLQKISYEGASCVSEPKKTPSFDFTLLKDSLKTSFIQSVSNNDYWVYDEYFSKHLVKEDGSIRKGHLHEVSLSENTEWEDFKLLVDLVKEQNMDAAFIIQPVNPFYYEGTENYQALVSAITNRLDERSIPYFNMYVSDTASYDKGTLMDVMHLGDYGWMQINEFLVEQFLENE